MMGKTHFPIGMASWLGVMAAIQSVHPGYLNPVMVLAGTAIAGVAALEPDIDTKNSLASKMLGPVSGAVSFGIRKAFGGHRKITHSLIGAVIVTGLILAMVAGFHWPAWIAGAFVAGWCSHVIADMLTKEGCPLFWPLSDYKFGVHLVTTGLDKKKGHHTSEYWVVRPMAVASIVGFGALIAIGM